MPEDYVQVDEKRVLKNDAVPSVFSTGDALLQKCV